VYRISLINLVLILLLSLNAWGQGDQDIIVDEPLILTITVTDAAVGGNPVPNAPFTLTASDPFLIFYDYSNQADYRAALAANTLVEIPSGSTLYSGSNGLRTFIVTSHSGVVDARFFIQNVNFPDASGNSAPLTFYPPRVRFVDEAGDEINDISVLTNQPVRVRAEVLLNDGVTIDSTFSRTLDLIKLLSPEQQDLLHFLNAPGGSEIDQIVTQNGLGTFWISGSGEITDGGFAVQGLYDSDGNPRIYDSFASGINIEFPDGPRIDSALVLDANGDGQGDSIVVYFDSTRAPISVFHTWPENDGDWQIIPAGRWNETTSGQRLVLGLNGIQDDISVIDKQGWVRANFTSASGPYADSSVLINKIGPVLFSAVIVKSGTDAPDSVFVTFSKDMAPFNSGDAFLINGIPVVASGEQIDGRDWKFALPAGVLQIGDSLRIDPLGDLIAADGNRPSANNQAVIVTGVGQVPAPSPSGNGFFDLDADGTLDHITLSFEEPLTPDQLELLALDFTWKDSNDQVISLRPRPADMEIDPTDSTKVLWDIPSHIDIQKMLTSIEDDSYGQGRLIRTYMVRGEIRKDTLDINMLDKMAPVIVSAWIGPELSEERRGDTLRVVFSEPIDIQGSDDRDFLRFYMGGAVRSFALESPVWGNDNRELQVFAAPGTLLSQRPNPGDSLRVVPGTTGLSDVEGNFFGENSRWTLMVGNPRVLIQYSSLVSRDLNKENEDRDPITVEFMDPENTNIYALNAQGRMGHLLDLGLVPELNGDGEIAIEDVKIDYEVRYYTNIGGYVAGRSGSIGCDDPGFEGNCFTNRKKIFIAWNLKAHNGRKVGNGAYVVKLYLLVRGLKEDYERQTIYNWGVGPEGN
jgi:hypothetical protein